MDHQVEEAVGKLAGEVLNSQIYKEYRIQLEKVKQQPKLKERIDEFRQRNYELQCSPDYAFDKMEQFEREYRGFREDPLVSDFLAAELALCRMMQEINSKLVEAIDFE